MLKGLHRGTKGNHVSAIVVTNGGPLQVISLGCGKVGSVASD